jgi:hypothetical protein
LRGHLIEVAARVVSAQHSLGIHPDWNQENLGVCCEPKKSIHGIDAFFA